MKHKMFFGLCIVLAVIFTIVLLVITFSQKEYLLGQKNGIYFGMSKNSLIQLKGNPEETESGSYDTLLTKYLYREVFCGYEATCRYYFQNERLIEADIFLSHIKKEQALQLMETIVGQQQELYSEREGYYCEEIDSEDEDQFSFSHGINTGHSGITFEFSYQSGQLCIYALKQE